MAQSEAALLEPIRATLTNAIDEFLCLYGETRQARIRRNEQLLSADVDFARDWRALHSYLNPARLAACFHNVVTLEKAGGANTSGYPNFSYATGSLVADSDEVDQRFVGLWGEIQREGSH